VRAADVAAGRETTPVARVRDLVVTFRRGGQLVRAVRGVDLVIGRGEILGLVGESGSGKTVLGHTLLGLIRSGRETTVSGAVVVEDLDLLRLDAAARRRLLREHVGAVFQDPMTSLNPSMRIGQQIGEICESEAAAVAALEASGLGHARTRLRNYPHQLSGGQRQRVMIAMAVARRPSLVIADEPTTALDVTIQAQVLSLIRRLRTEVGSSFLLITHDLGVAAEVADRIAVMYAGRIVEVALARELLEAPQHPYTRGLLGSRVSLYGGPRRDLPVLPGLPPDPTDPDHGCAFAPRCAHVAEACQAIPQLGGRAEHVVACWWDGTDLTRSEQALPADIDRLLVAEPTFRREATADEQPVVAIREARRDFVVRQSPRHSTPLRALRGIDLELMAGDSLAIVGESGCGKSTLLRAIAGLERIDSGSIVRRRDARVQMVFQDAASSLTPWLSVEELIAERLLMTAYPTRAKRTERVHALLGLVGLPPTVARARSRQLSGGQNQRVALARAVASEPTLLLADEPTSSLDVSLAATVLNLLLDLRRRLGFALVFVTHDLAIARTVSERLAVMYLGEIVELGPTQDVLGSPRHPYPRALVRAQPGQGGSLAGRPLVKGDPPNPLDIPSGCPYHPRCVEALASCVIDVQELLPVQGAAHFVRCVLRHQPNQPPA
jgi:peptide/nickel transport system ATP-binding protein